MRCVHGWQRQRVLVTGERMKCILLCCKGRVMGSKAKHIEFGGGRVGQKKSRWTADDIHFDQKFMRKTSNPKNRNVILCSVVVDL